MIITGSFLSKKVDCNSNNTSTHNNGNIEVIFIGTLYNGFELGFSTHSSNAQIAYTLFDQDIKALKQLDGSFIIIIKNSDSIIIVRDYHGTHSQIYYNKSHFASSLYDLSNTPGFESSINYSSLSSFLNIGYIDTPNSAFKNVSKIPAGCALIVKNNQFNTLNLHPSILKPTVNHGKSLEELSQEYGSIHRESIKKRIGDNDNVGILLSGGYDSGSNLSALRSIYNGEINSYSIGFKGDNWSELPLARCMSKHFNTVHHEYEIDGSEINSLPDIVKVIGDPFVEGGLMVNYCAMKMIGDNKPNVILGGDGSDQYFGTSGREAALHYLISKNGLMPFARAVRSMLSNKAFEKDNKAYRIRFHLDKIINILHGDLFGVPDFLLKEIIQKDKYAFNTNKIKPDTSSFDTLYTQHAIVSDLEKIINQVILFKASRMAEMFDNNLVYPFMDKNLFDFIQQLPTELKCKGDSVKNIARGNCTSKFLLKHHYKSQLPPEITSKKKQGGFAPMPVFFKDNKQREKISDFIMNSSIISSFLNKKGVEDFIKQYNTSQNNNGNWFWYSQNKAIQYFNLFTLSIWWETYIQRNKSITL